MLELLRSGTLLDTPPTPLSVAQARAAEGVLTQELTQRVRGVWNAGVATDWNIVGHTPTPLSVAQARAAEGSFNSRVDEQKSPL